MSILKRILNLIENKVDKYINKKVNAERNNRFDFLAKKGIIGIHRKSQEVKPVVVKSHFESLCEIHNVIDVSGVLSSGLSNSEKYHILFNLKRLTLEDVKYDFEASRVYHSCKPRKKIEEPPVVEIKEPVIESSKEKTEDDQQYKNGVERLSETLKTFGIEFDSIEYVKLPTLVQYRIKLSGKMKYSQVRNLQKEIQGSLHAPRVRILTPIPFTDLVGIETPRENKEIVKFVDTFDKFDLNGSLDTALGISNFNKMVTLNIKKMPHLLVAGTTGSGKSVCLNTMIVSLILRNTKENLRLVLIDPKRAEFSPYEGLPLLRGNVIYDAEETLQAIDGLVSEMEVRYKLFADNGVSDIESYNKKCKRIPYIVVFVEEFADLILMSKGKRSGKGTFQEGICRLAQKSRACGIHLVLATQRPSVDVVSGLIKSNFPSRIAFNVSSQVDSRTIIDKVGAESLMGNGDMLYLPSGESEPMRIQGSFISREEIIYLVNKLNGR